MIYKGFTVAEVSMKSVSVQGIREKRAQKGQGRMLMINLNIFFHKVYANMSSRGRIVLERFMVYLAVQLGQGT